MDRFQGDTIRLYSEVCAKAPLLLISPGKLEGAVEVGSSSGFSSQDLLNRHAFGGFEAAQRPANDNSDAITQVEL